MYNWMPISSFIYFTTKGITPSYVERSSIIVLNQKCIRNNKIDYSFAQFTDDSKNIPDSKFVREGDILVNSTGTGTAGRCAFVSQLPKEHRLIVDSHILILRCDSFDTAQCLSYSLFSFEKTLMSFMTGSSGQSELDKVVLLNLKTKMPSDLSTQQQIASVLSSLDAKIELNNRINAELEAMAKTLYDYWFVQFDFPFDFAQGKPNVPGVVAERSRGYKSSGGKMVYNAELRMEIPVGWEVKKLGKVLSTKLGGTPSTEIKEYWDNGEFHWLNSGEIANFPIITSELKITKKAIENSSTYLLPKGTIAISITRHIRPSILAIDSCANQSVIGILESEELKSSYLYPLIRNEIPRYLSLRTGAQQPHINKQTIDKTNIIIPSNDILKKYYQASNQYYKKIINNAFQNQQLSELRDWLLPMLMNGQITVTSAGSATSEETKEGISNNEKPIINLPVQHEQRFKLWLNNQGVAARGNIDTKTLRDIFDAMDDEDK